MNDSVCHGCAVAIVNGDSTHLDDAAEQKVNAYAERVGMVVVDIDSPTGDGADCDACGQQGLMRYPVAAM